MKEHNDGGPHGLIPKVEIQYVMTVARKFMGIAKETAKHSNL